MTATTPPDADGTDPATLGRLAGSVGALAQQLGDVRRRLDTTTRRLDNAGLDQLAAQLEALQTRITGLRADLTGALNAVAPRGPAAPRWDDLDALAREALTGSLRAWVAKILVPWYVQRGGYTLATCWDKHPHVLVELSTVATAWGRAYRRRRPDLELALEWHEKWLPGVMDRVNAATRDCQGPLGHQRTGQPAAEM